MPMSGLGSYRWPALFVCACLLVTGCGSAPSPLGTEQGRSATDGHIALAGRVTDAAHILTAEQIESLTHYLANFEARSRHQMVVVTVPTLNDRDVAYYTRDLANRWGIGRKGANDGIVVLVAPNERRIRIAVGYGLEKIVTNDYCQRIITQVVTPEFRKGQYYDGLILGVTGLARVARRV